MLFWLIIGLDVKFLSCIEPSFSLEGLSEKLEKKLLGTGEPGTHVEDL